MPRFPFLAFLLCPVVCAETHLVENGMPRAQIVIAEEAPRSVRLAAAELQATLEKMSGASLPIGTEPGEGIPVYVGE
ncbi:MAG: hypothetical protein AAF191_14680, partial [Verrucomicrobiota bacterium]